MVVGSSLDYDGYFLEPTYTVKVTDAMDIQIRLLMYQCSISNTVHYFHKGWDKLTFMKITKNKGQADRAGLTKVKPEWELRK